MNYIVVDYGAYKTKYGFSKLYFHTTYYSGGYISLFHKYQEQRIYLSKIKSFDIHVDDCKGICHFSSVFD